MRMGATAAPAPFPTRAFLERNGPATLRIRECPARVCPAREQRVVPRRQPLEKRLRFLDDLRSVGHHPSFRPSVRSHYTQRSAPAGALRCTLRRKGSSPDYSHLIL